MNVIDTLRAVKAIRKCPPSRRYSSAAFEQERSRTEVCLVEFLQALSEDDPRGLLMWSTDIEPREAEE